jgi:hypothetical protein
MFKQWPHHPHQVLQGLSYSFEELLMKRFLLFLGLSVRFTFVKGVLWLV